jgi:hypothetical protein
MKFWLNTYSPFLSIYTAGAAARRSHPAAAAAANECVQVFLFLATRAPRCTVYKLPLLQILPPG